MDHLWLMWICPNGLQLLEGIFPSREAAERHARGYLAPGTPYQLQIASGAAFFVRVDRNVMWLDQPQNLIEAGR